MTTTITEEATMAPEIRIRQATREDAFDVRRLAALDDSRPLKGEILLAEQAGELLAAISLEDGRVVANPFAPTMELVNMLRMHREHVSSVAA